MPRLSIRLLTLAATACLMGTVSAQTAAPTKPAAPAAKPAAKKAAPAKAAPKPVVEETLPAAGGDQTAAAQMAHFGHYDCEFNQAVEVAMNPKYDGYVDVTFGKQKYTMKPVLSSTGALRLEDVKGQTLMLQIAYKSMLMDVKAGRRLVDECVSEKQRMAKQAAAGQPSAGLMDGAGASTAAPTSR